MGSMKAKFAASSLFHSGKHYSMTRAVFPTPFDQVLGSLSNPVSDAVARYRAWRQYWGLSSKWTENRGKPERYGE
jgi:hypothetical protein